MHAGPGEIRTPVGCHSLSITKMSNFLQRSGQNSQAIIEGPAVEPSRYFSEDSSSVYEETSDRMKGIFHNRSSIVLRRCCALRLRHSNLMSRVSERKAVTIGDNH